MSNEKTVVRDREGNRAITTDGVALIDGGGIPWPVGQFIDRSDGSARLLNNTGIMLRYRMDRGSFEISACLQD